MLYTELVEHVRQREKELRSSFAEATPSAKEDALARLNDVRYKMKMNLAEQLDKKTLRRDSEEPTPIIVKSEVKVKK